MFPDRPVLAPVAQISSLGAKCYRLHNSGPGRRLKSDPPSRLALLQSEGRMGWGEAALGDAGFASG
jgi:hypothetical protein